MNYTEFTELEVIESRYLKLAKALPGANKIKNMKDSREFLKQHFNSDQHPDLYKEFGSGIYIYTPFMGISRNLISK